MSDTNAKNVGAVIKGPTAPITIINNFNGETRSANNLIRFVDLPNLDTPVYGREVEANMLANFFATHNRHCAVVAPSCFGKTFLIRKFLQNVNANDEFYKDSFNQIIYFNCREITDTGSIIGKFETCLGGKIEPTSFFSLIADKKILCIFDNFESWNDNREAIHFLHNIFNANDELRTIFVSQTSIGDENLNDKITELREIGNLLFRGLDKQAALNFARTEGKKVNLNNVSEEKLIEFFFIVHYIPQAIRSLIGYLSRKRRTFEDFLAKYQAEFADYENSPTRFINVNDELRPTLYLIQLQIEAQDEGSKTLLSVLSFFESDVPESVVAAFSPQVSAVEKETIHSLSDNWLVVETKFSAKTANEPNSATIRLIPLSNKFRETFCRNLKTKTQAPLNLLQ